MGRGLWTDHAVRDVTQREATGCHPEISARGGAYSCTLPRPVVQALEIRCVELETRMDKGHCRQCRGLLSTRRSKKMKALGLQKSTMLIQYISDERNSRNIAGISISANGA